ncbi:MAG: hypothetical protein IPL46_19085 [Saprospiraceae bacterium]|nr:hypothetical protein [Saprospiraceae bacterium]
MKKCTLAVVGLLLGITLFGQNLPEVFSSIPIKVNEGHSPPEVTNYIKALNRGLSQFGRGIGAWISYGDRGERAQQLVWGFTFDFKESRDYYFPKADDTSDAGSPQFAALFEKIADSGIDLNQNLTEAEPYTDWVCVGYDQLINPQLGGLVAVRTIPIKSGSESSFEKFVTSELYPAYQKNDPGFNAYVFKGDRGQGKGAYIMLWSFQSVSQRNSFFPTPEGEATETFTKAYANISPVMDKLAQFTDSTIEATAYTDYISIDVGN